MIPFPFPSFQTLQSFTFTCLSAHQVFYTHTREGGQANTRTHTSEPAHASQPRQTRQPSVPALSRVASLLVRASSISFDSCRSLFLRPSMIDIDFICHIRQSAIPLAPLYALAADAGIRSGDLPRLGWSGQTFYFLLHYAVFFLLLNCLIVAMCPAPSLLLPAVAFVTNTRGKGERERERAKEGG